VEETVYTACAAAGATLVLLQVILQSLGLFGEVDIDMDGHADGDMGGGDSEGGDSEGHGNVFFGILSFKALCAFSALFGLVGLIMLEQTELIGVRIAVSVAAGVSGMIVVAALMRGLSKLQQSGTVRIANAVGKTGSCYLRIPANGSGVGKVTLELQGRTVELAARTDGDEIPTGARISVISVDSDNTVSVKPA